MQAWLAKAKDEELAVDYTLESWALLQALLPVDEILARLGGGSEPEVFGSR
jgi:hypothetical protein